MKKYLLVFITSLFLIPNAMAIINTESIPENSDANPALNFNENSNSTEVAHVLLFKEARPVCAVSALENPVLLPAGFKAIRSEHSIDLPKCNREEMAFIQYYSQQAVLLKEGTESYQTAMNMSIKVGGPASFPVCLAAGVLAQIYKEEFNVEKLTKTLVAIGVTAPVVGFVGGMMTYSSTSPGLATILAGSGIGIGLSTLICTGIGAAGYHILEAFRR